MAEIGFTLMRLFEFAWHRFEPEEGKYDFDWALRVLDLLHERGIKAMIGTPTAAPPAWLTSKYPEVLRVNAAGKSDTHGKRCHASPASERYREHAKRIAAKMADVFNEHPALHSWQIDNEMSGFDYGPEAQQRFREYLKRRFGNIVNLNKAWGLEFWSQAYNSFDQINMCTASVGSIEVPERHNPSLILAVADFQNECWNEFIACQCEQIRGKSDKPITTNMVGLVGPMDWFRLNRNFDFVGASMYSDREHYYFNFPRFDRMRAEKPGSRHMLLETAPNWSGNGPVWNIHYTSEGVRLFSWINTMFGSCGTLFWQWRGHWAGQEMQHGTHVSSTGKWNPGKSAWAQLAKEYGKLGPWLAAHPPAPAEVAIVLSVHASWAFSIDPIHAENRYQERWRDDYYMPLCRNHIYRDVICPDHDYSAYKLIVLPHCPVVEPGARQRLVEWVKNGGTLVLGPLTGYRTEEFTAFTDREFGGLEELLGAECVTRFSPHWIEDQVEVRFTDGHVCHPRFWCDGFKPTSAKAQAIYSGGWSRGEAAVLENSYGKGCVIGLGCPVDETTYMRLISRAMKRAGVSPVAEGSGRILVAPRCDDEGRTVAYGLANTSQNAGRICLPFGGKDLLSGQSMSANLELEPGGIRLIEMES